MSTKQDRAKPLYSDRVRLVGASKHIVIWSGSLDDQ